MQALEAIDFDGGPAMEDGGLPAGEAPAGLAVAVIAHRREQDELTARAVPERALQVLELRELPEWRFAALLGRALIVKRLQGGV